MQDKVFETLEGEQLQPYMDAIELEGNAAQPMDEGGVEEEKVRLHVRDPVMFRSSAPPYIFVGRSSLGVGFVAQPTVRGPSRFRPRSQRSTDGKVRCVDAALMQAFVFRAETL